MLRGEREKGTERKEREREREREERERGTEKGDREMEEERGEKENNTQTDMISETKEHRKLFINNNMKLNSSYITLILLTGIILP